MKNFKKIIVITSVLALGSISIVGAITLTKNAEITSEKKIIVNTKDDSENKKYPIIGKCMNIIDHKYTDVLQGDIIHRINIEKVQDSLKGIEVGSMVELQTEYINGKEVATDLKIYIEQEGAPKFDTMGRRIYEFTGNLIGYNDNYIDVQQDDMILRIECHIPKFRERFENNIPVSVSYIIDEYDGETKLILIDIQKE